MKRYYDTVIVGAGPTGLALAQCLRHSSKRTLILDSVEEIGGCHRVVRVNGLLTEHGPRVYMSNYKNFAVLLEEMGARFDDLFTPYRFSPTTEMTRQAIRSMGLRELWHTTTAFLLFLLDADYGKETTLHEFATKHDFNNETLTMLDRAARMADGVGADRASLNQLFQWVNHSFFYRIYQPKTPNDEGLFMLWRRFLTQDGRVEIAAPYDVIGLSYDAPTNRIVGVRAARKKTSTVVEIGCRRVILAVPPHAITRILGGCHKKARDAFMPFPRLLRYAAATSYLAYVSMTFHWKEKLDLPSIHGFPVGEWGIIYIVLSDYMTNAEKNYKTLLSCCVSQTDAASTRTGKTANQSTRQETLDETLRQLRTALPQLTDPDAALVSPQNQRHGQAWRQHDTSYVSTQAEPGPLPSHGSIENLFNAGTHNQKTTFPNTTLESAVANAVALARQLDPNSTTHPQRLWTLRGGVAVMVVAIVITTILIVAARRKKK